MELDFSNLHLIVTGGTGTLGSAVTKLLLDAGAKCSVPSFEEMVPENFHLVEHKRLYLQTDVDLTKETQAQKFYKQAVGKQGDLWGSVNIAGGFGMGKIEDMPLKDFQQQVNLNTLTCYNSCRAAVQMIREGKHVEGRIVNIASRPALEPRQGGGMTSYTASKAAVAALTESLAAELAEEQILVNAVAPSIIDTPANRKAMPDADFEQWPKGEEIATLIAYLASKKNYVVRGAVIPAYGRS
ncbi:MAG: SDR family NAD(P)-dependent oxidoreductase [Balneolaceae bacterium]|nr:SDR family NAD(P)-dependent oxidoreductase [Balneolaceae bacterium]